MKQGKQSWATRKRLDRILQERLAKVAGDIPRDGYVPAAESSCGIRAFISAGEGRRRCGNCGNYHAEEHFSGWLKFASAIYDAGRKVEELSTVSL